MTNSRIDRRKFIRASAGTIGLVSAGQCATAAESVLSPRTVLQNGKADSCIFIWLGGGACHLDTFDPKRVGDPARKGEQPGSAYPKIKTAIPGEYVCMYLSKLADRMDRGVIIRSLNHGVIDEHAAAVNRMHVGRPASGTTIYPSIGSMVIHERPPENPEVPGYVLMGYPSATRGPGFLGSKYGYVYLTDTNAGPAGLRLPIDVTRSRMNRRQELLQTLGQFQVKNNAGIPEFREQMENTVAGLKLAGPRFMANFDLQAEPGDLRQKYGNEFGQRCLLARRLVQSGVRFVEVGFNLNFINGTGWDTHNDGQRNQHVLIQQLDQAVATLIDDLEAKKLLDSTLVVITTEFGRPPEFDGGGGRGHQSTAFSSVLFGGGMKTGQVIGETDDLAKKITRRPVSIADFHATLFHSLKIDPTVELYDGDRPVPLTDHGKPVAELFA